MKLYKRTLIISILVFLICVLLSYAFKFTCMSQFEICSFLLDYMIGIACSSLVVIITTFLQFKNEQKTMLNSILFDVSILFFNCFLTINLFDSNEKQCEKYYDEIEEKLYKLSLNLLEIEWFSIRKEKTTRALSNAICEISIIMDKYSLGEIDTAKETLFLALSSTSLKEIKDSALSFISSNDFRAKDILENYQQIQNKLEKLDDKK